jgi:hypothetical protein
MPVSSGITQSQCRPRLTYASAYGRTSNLSAACCSLAVQELTVPSHSALSKSTWPRSPALPCGNIPPQFQESFPSRSKCTVGNAPARNSSCRTLTLTTTTTVGYIKRVASSSWAKRTRRLSTSPRTAGNGTIAWSRLPAKRKSTASIEPSGNPLNAKLCGSRANSNTSCRSLTK